MTLEEVRANYINLPIIKVNKDKTITRKGLHICDRCSGLGVLPFVVANGVCFACGGSKVVNGLFTMETEESIALKEEYKKQRKEAEKQMKVVYIKEWFVKKDGTFLVNKQYKVVKETEKAFLIRMELQNDVWCPKSATLSIEEYEQIVAPTRARIVELKSILKNMRDNGQDDEDCAERVELDNIKWNMTPLNVLQIKTLELEHNRVCVIK